MVDRVYAAGASASPPALPASPSSGYPVSGSPQGIPATKPGPYWYYMVLEELMNVVGAAGLTPAAGALNQVAQALQSGALWSAAAGGSADALTATFNPVVTALTNGMQLSVRASQANATPTPTFTPAPTGVGAIPSKVIVKGANQALAPGDIAGGGHWVDLQYDKVLDKWVLLNPATGVSPVAASSYRNLLVNGEMRVAQQYGTALQTPASATWVIDQWQYGATQASKFSFQQVSGPTALGFDTYAQFTVASAYTVGASDYFQYAQNIEAQNLAQLAWGTQNAKPVSLQFVVNSSVTGTFSGALRNGAGTRSYPFTFTINAANTDTVITIPNIPGDTTGTWTLTGTGIGLTVIFNLGAGSTYTSSTQNAWVAGAYNGATGTVSLVATAGATFKITGVQLEAGPICTSCDRPTPEAGWARCQRYLPGIVAGSASDQIGLGYISNASTLWMPTQFKVPARASITGMIASPASTFSLAAASGTQVASGVAFAAGGTAGASVIFSGSGLVAGQSATTLFNSAAGKIIFTGAQL